LPVVTPSVTDSSCAIVVEPPPAEAPVIFTALCTVQVKVVPATLFGLVIAMLVVCPVQIEASAAKAVGFVRSVSVAAVLVKVEHVPVISTEYCAPFRASGIFESVNVGVVVPLNTPPSDR
jgi:hypothetical protein